MVQEMITFKVVFYVKGCFVKEPDIRYDGGDVIGFNSQAIYYWSFFEARDLLKTIEFEFDEKTIKMW